jgi:N6-L-threonylcarbamoyladenine synthase
VPGVTQSRFCASGLESVNLAAAKVASGFEDLVVAGGVGANRYLRAQLQERTAQRGARVFFPRPDLCTDNGAMIAYAGCLRLLAGQSEPPVVACAPRWDLAGLPPLSPALG